MTAGKKLFLSRLVRVLRLLYLFPDGRRWKRVCPGFVGSMMMLAAFPRQREVQSMDGRLVYMMDWALLITFHSGGISRVNMWGPGDRAWVGLPLVQA